MKHLSDVKWGLGVLVAEDVSQSRWEHKGPGSRKAFKDSIPPASSSVRLIHTRSVSEPEQVQTPPAEWPQCAEEQSSPCGWVVNRERGGGCGNQRQARLYS